MTKFPGNGIVLAGVGCVIGLAILNELMELNYHARRVRYIRDSDGNISMDSSGACDVEVTANYAAHAADVVASDEIMDEAREVVKSTRARNGRFVKNSPDKCPDCGDTSPLAECGTCDG